MASPPQAPPLKEADLHIPDGDIKGDQLRKAFGRLFAVLNPFFDSVTKFGGSITLGENELADLLTGSFTHGVPTAFRLQKLTTARSAIVRSCSGATPIGTPSVRMQPQQFPGAPAVALVTMFFTNPAARGVQAMVELREEGPSLSNLPLVDGVAARYAQTLTQVIPTNAETVINFDTLIRDTDAAVVPGSDWRFQVPSNKAGLYLCQVSCSFVFPNPSVAFNTLRLSVRQNGSSVGRLFSIPVTAPAGTIGTFSGAVPLFVSDGDVIDFVLYQDSGGNLSTTSNAQLLLGTVCNIVRLLGY